MCVVNRIWPMVTQWSVGAFCFFTTSFYCLSKCKTLLSSLQQALCTVYTEYGRLVVQHINVGLLDYLTRICVASMDILYFAHCNAHYTNQPLAHMCCLHAYYAYCPLAHLNWPYMYQYVYWYKQIDLLTPLPRCPRHSRVQPSKIKSGPYL